MRSTKNTPGTNMAAKTRNPATGMMTAENESTPTEGDTTRETACLEKTDQGTTTAIPEEATPGVRGPKEGYPIRNMKGKPVDSHIIIIIILKS